MEDFKKEILREIFAELEREIATLSDAVQEAVDAATHEESRAENKYDTRGLEASYLAHGQGQRVLELKKTLGSMQLLEIREYDENTAIQATALVKVDIDGERESLFFMVPQQGGMKLQVGGQEVLTLSPESPLGKLLFGKKVGDGFVFKVKGVEKEYEVVAVE